MRLKRLISEFLPVLLFTTLGFLVMGYHPGLEDDGVYLTAVKADLNPALFPHNAEFFRLQLQATLFDGWMAHFVQWTGIPLAWAELGWQFVSLFLILWACDRIAKQLFGDRRAQWAAVAMVAAMLTLPVAGTALNIAEDVYKRQRKRNGTGSSSASVRNTQNEMPSAAMMGCSTKASISRGTACQRFPSRIREMPSRISAVAR